MKQIATFLFCFSMLQFGYSQDNFRSFLDSAMAISDSTQRVSYVETFVNHLDTVGVPIIEGDTAFFVFYDEAEEVGLAGDFNGWNGADPWLCHRIEKTNFFYYSQWFEATARLDYKIIVDGVWILDPMNPNQVSGGYGPNSELAMSDYVQPWEIISYDGISKGTISQINLESPEMGKTYSIQIYLPPGYDPMGSIYYPTAYVHDGHEYIGLGSMNNILDNLLDSNKIDPVVGVFIRPKNRSDEYAEDNRFNYAEFIAKTVVPHIDQNYNTIPLKETRLTMGASYGGNTSGLIAYTYPEVFANSGWHSPALWPNDGEVAEMYMSAKKDIKIYFNVGTYENLGVDWNIFTSELTSLGYEYSWDTYHEGHSWGLWRATTDNILTYFFPKGSTPDFQPSSIYESYTANYSVGQNYPNPFNETTTIPLLIEEPGNYVLEVYNQLGQKLISKKYFYPVSGEHNIILETNKLNTGVYYYVISGNNYRISMKMVKD